MKCSHDCKQQNELVDSHLERSISIGLYVIIRPSQTAAFPTFAAKLIYLVILQSLGDTTFFKRAVQTDDIHLVILQSLGDTTFFKRAVQTDTQSL